LYLHPDERKGHFLHNPIKKNGIKMLQFGEKCVTSHLGFAPIGENPDQRQVL
jgi:hypothetical protein